MTLVYCGRQWGVMYISCCCRHYNIDRTRPIPIMVFWQPFSWQSAKMWVYIMQQSLLLYRCFPIWGRLCFYESTASSLEGWCIACWEVLVGDRARARIRWWKMTLIISNSQPPTIIYNQYCGYFIFHSEYQVYIMILIQIWLNLDTEEVCIT